MTDGYVSDDDWCPQSMSEWRDQIERRQRDFDKARMYRFALVEIINLDPEAPAADIARAVIDWS